MNSVNSQENTFVSIGPDVGTIRNIIADITNPDTVYALTSNGLLISVDGGEKWKSYLSPRENILECFSVSFNQGKCYFGGNNFLQTLIPNSQYPAWEYKRINFTLSGINIDIYTDSAIHGYGLSAINHVFNICYFRSTDEGENWTITPVFAFSSKVGRYNNCWTIDENDYQTLYIATSDFDGSAFHPRLFRSPDGGNTWNTLKIESLIADDDYIRGIDIDINGNPVICFGDSGIYRSTDSGNSWTKLSDSRVLFDV